MPPTLELMDALVSTTPLPTDQFQYLPTDKLSAWQEAAVHCLRSICMKMALYLSLINHTGVHKREVISSALATFVMESQAINKDTVDAFLTEQFALHSVDLDPNGKYLASEDFISAFGFQNVFQSSVAHHLLRLCQVMISNPGMAAPAAIDQAFPGSCVCGEILPRLAEIAAEIVAHEAV